MNIFRLVGDSSHLLAFIILLLKIWKTKSCAGLSGKSQILFALVYSTRYLDLFSHFVSTYNSVMKVVYIGACYSILYLMYMKFKTTYERNQDTFRIELLIIPVLVLALVFNYNSNSLLEISWTFSIYLESVAILPQFLVSATGKAETIPFYYLICLGSYRSFYLLNWVYRYYTEGFYDVISITGGIVQTVLYCDFFFYLYITKADNIRPYLSFFQRKDTNAGFVDADGALKPVFPLKESIDFVLIMPAKPEFEGQKFMEDRIVKVHHLKSAHPNLDKADSGVGPNAVVNCSEVDANLIVSDTATTASSDPKQDISCLNRPD